MRTVLASRVLALAIVCGVMRGFCAGAGPGQDPQSRPAADPQRVADLLALIEQENSAQVRRTGVSELLRLGLPETPPRLATILNGGNNTAARVAVAAALADLPEALDPAYVDPLLAMLGDADADARRAAALALAAYRDNEVIRRLREIASAVATPLATRLAAVDCLGRMTQRAAVAALVELLADEASPVCRPALAAIEQSTGMSFEDSPRAARDWWKRGSSANAEEWQQQQIERLADRYRDVSRRQRTLEARLAKTQRDLYLHTPEAERGTLLAGFLSDPLSSPRLLGLELVQALIAEGKTLPAEIIPQVRPLLTDRDAAVRAAAVRTVAALRADGDQERFTQLLSAETNADVRRALISGLGYLGSASVVPDLLRIVSSNDDLFAGEAATALAKLAERGQLSGESRNATAAALVGRYRAAGAQAGQMREQLLWAMALLGDSSFAPVFEEALSSAETPTLRQAAARGLATLRDPTLTARLLQAVSDADAGVRKTAVEALAEFGSTDEHVQALWTRLSPAQEPDDSIRQSAWRGALRMLGSRTPAQVQSYAQKLPGDLPELTLRTIELLVVLERLIAADPTNRAALADVRARLARQRTSIGQLDEALAGYMGALEAGAGQTPEGNPALGGEVLRFCMRNERYSAKVAAALAADHHVTAAAACATLHEEVDRRVAAEQVPQALELIQRILDSPPCVMTDEAIADLNMLSKRLKNSGSTSQPAERTNPGGDISADAGAKPHGS